MGYLVFCCCCATWSGNGTLNYSWKLLLYSICEKALSTNVISLYIVQPCWINCCHLSSTILPSFYRYRTSPKFNQILFEMRSLYIWLSMIGHTCQTWIRKIVLKLLKIEHILLYIRSVGWLLFIESCSIHITRCSVKATLLLILQYYWFSIPL